MPVIIACLGSSSTAGRGQAYDWIAELRRRPANADFDLRNFGVGGDLAYNALQRVPGVVAVAPAKVIVWVGANDVLALVSPRLRRFFGLVKQLPRDPSPSWFAECLTAIARTLKAQTAAAIGLCSLPPVGEAPDSADPFQAALNRRVAEFSAIVADVARANGCAYIPLYEAFIADLTAMPGRAFTDFRFLPFYRDAFRVAVLRQSVDDVAARNGWRLHSDGVHLNSRGGRLVVDSLQTFIDEPSSLRPP